MKKALVESIKNDLVRKGFILKDDYIDSSSLLKGEIKEIHYKAKANKLIENESFIYKNFEFVKEKTLSLDEIDFDKLDIEIRFVSSREDRDLFRWWNNVWWSIPFDKAVGRQIRYFLWDKYYDVPIGMVYLSSPTINVKDVNTFLNLNYENKIKTINQSMNIIRFGALPPFNLMLVGKLVSMSTVSKEVRLHFKEKYNTELLYLITTGAFGNSSILNRLKYDNTKLFENIGQTSGTGTFQFSESVYQEMINYIETNDLVLKKGIKSGSSNKITNVCTALRSIGYPKYIYHNIKRQVYLQPLCGNLYDVIHNNVSPKYYDWTFDEMYQYWSNRWLKKRLLTYECDFCKETYFEDLIKEMENIHYN